MEPRTVLILVRHGETSANIDQVWHGSLDTPLTPRGRLQAERVAERIRGEYPELCALYSSNLERARHTAEAIAAAVGIERRGNDDLREYGLGEWEGKPFAELHTELGFFERIRRDPDFAPRGGETPAGVAARFTAALRKIASDHSGRQVVVVAHGGALSMAMGAMLDGHYSEWHSVMDNCAISELVFAPEPALLSFNRNDHLEDL